MSEAGELSRDARSARLCADWLGFGRRLDAASLMLAVVALAAMLWRSPPAAERALLAAAILVAAVEKVLALRVAFDRRVFLAWAADWEAAAANDVTATLGAFDAALAACGLVRRVPSPRPLATRLRGAVRLYHLQIGAVATQLALTLAAAAVA